MNIIKKGNQLSPFQYLHSANCRFKPPPASAGNCLVIEDSMAGVEAGLLAGMQVSFS